MPVLDFGNPMAPLAAYRAQIAVRAVMAWPDPADDPARREYTATLMSMHLAQFETARKTLPNPLTTKGRKKTIKAAEEHGALMALQDHFEAWFEAEGGHYSVSKAPGFLAFQNDFQNRVGSWFAAGVILALVRRMAAHHADLPGGASVNKAMFILERTKPPLVPRNERDLRKAWAKYRSVAHFCATLFDWFMIAFEYNETPEKVGAALEVELNDNFLTFLSVAEAYLEFGLAYRLPRAKAPTLLDPKDTWTLPKLRSWPDLPSKPTPLTGALLEAALEYRAPIPGV